MDENPHTEPAQPYVDYPRPHLVYGSPDRLQALSDGYFGLNGVFAVNVVLLIVGRVVSLVGGDLAPILFLLSVVVTGVVVGFMSYPYNKKIAYGKGWTDVNAAIASVLMGLNSALCCGIVGYVVMQSLALQEIKRYGVQGGFFGIRKKDVQRTIDLMRSNQTPPVTPL